MRDNTVWVNEISELLITSKNSQYTVTQVYHQETLALSLCQPVGWTGSVGILILFYFSFQALMGRLVPFLVPHFVPPSQGMYAKDYTTITIQDNAYTFWWFICLYRSDLPAVYENINEPNKPSFLGKLNMYTRGPTFIMGRRCIWTKKALVFLEGNACVISHGKSISSYLAF